MDGLTIDSTIALLSVEQKELFLRDGILVVDDILSQSEVEEAKKGLQETLSRNGVNNKSLLTGTPDDEDSARALQQLSTTNGSGGVRLHYLSLLSSAP